MGVYCSSIFCTTRLNPFATSRYTYTLITYDNRTVPILHPSVTDLVKPDLVGYFALPGEILTSLVPGGFSKRPWSILLLPGEQFSFPGDVC